MLLCCYSRCLPVTPGHLLLLSKADGIATTVMDTTPGVAASVFKEPPRLAKAVQEATVCDGVNFVQNNGTVSGRAVFHAHIHIIPRYDNDGLIKLPVGQTMIAIEDGVAMQSKIQDKL
uniref:HIT domain-containing protein n=1 Tax=Peronospora matthiolae TaxID=2874970 RepID=A0AAV1U0M4_9STRA